MKRQQQPRTTWLGRLVRGRRPDRNPLRRTSDRVETAILGTLLVTLLAGSPGAAHAASDWAYARSLHTEQAQQATARQVTAFLLEAAPASSGWVTTVPAEARWRAPDGRSCTGQVPAPSRASAGSRVLVWTTLDGMVTSQPLQMSQVSNAAVMAGAGAVGALAVTLLITGWVTRWALDRRRLAAWQADWLASGPRGTSRR